MADNRRKAPPKASPQAPPAAGADEPGHLGYDDRGNVTWEWSAEDELTADDTVGNLERVRALVDPSLKVTEDELLPGEAMPSSPKGLKAGYNPYNSGALGKKDWKKKKNLRELSKWIELRKKVADKPPEG